MNISTARLEPDNPMPADMVWGQGPAFNNRLVQEINRETDVAEFVIYRLTVDNITSALIARCQAGVQMQVLTEPFEDLNRKWPEFWITHANLDKLWAAGVPMKQRAHAGLTHMKTLVTSTYASNASSNTPWRGSATTTTSSRRRQSRRSTPRSRTASPRCGTTRRRSCRSRREPADAATLASPGNTATAVSTTPTLTWNIATFATSYDVYLGTSSTSLGAGRQRQGAAGQQPAKHVLVDREHGARQRHEGLLEDRVAHVRDRQERLDHRRVSGLVVHHERHSDDAATTAAERHQHRAEPARGRLLARSGAGRRRQRSRRQHLDPVVDSVQ